MKDIVKTTTKIETELNIVKITNVKYSIEDALTSIKIQFGITNIDEALELFKKDRSKLYSTDVILLDGYFYYTYTEIESNVKCELDNRTIEVED